MLLYGDEAHLFKSVEVSSLVKNCTNASIRIGTTGTLDNKKINSIHLQGIFGTIRKMITIRELIDRGEVADIDLYCVVLKHQEPPKFTDYFDEMDWIVSNEQRNKFLVKLANRCEGNTIVMFQFIDRHGRPLYEMAKKVLKNKTVVYIAGDVNLEEREDIKAMFRERDDIILFASLRHLQHRTKCKDY
jgi:superfamily II DNA or RNA helicase